MINLRDGLCVLCQWPAINDFQTLTTSCVRGHVFKDEDIEDHAKPLAELLPWTREGVRTYIRSVAVFELREDERRSEYLRAAIPAVDRNRETPARYIGNHIFGGYYF